MTIAPSPAETAEMMFGCFKRLRHLVDSGLSGCGMSLSRTKLLSELAREGPMQQGALASAFNLAPRTVTELVDTLERDGLVERRTDPADRRARQVHLTPAGEQARAQAVAIKAQLIDRVMGSLSEEQLAELTRALQLIGAQLDTIDEPEGSLISLGTVADFTNAP